MTSFALVFGILPLAAVSGSDAGSQNVIGCALVGGTLTATFLAVFFVPLFFAFVKRCFAKKDAKDTGVERRPNGGRPSSSPARQVW